MGQGGYVALATGKGGFAGPEPAQENQCLVAGWLTSGALVDVVGDAAGQVKVTTVGGIVTGLRGAMGVAEAILSGGPSRELRALRRELDLHLLLRRTMHEFKQADYSRMVDLLNDSTMRSLATYSRDEAWKVLSRVCFRQPIFLWLGLRGLLTSRRSIVPPRP